MIWVEKISRSEFGFRLFFVVKFPVVSFLSEFVKIAELPSRELTYPTLGKGKSSSKCHFWEDMLVPWRVDYRLLAAKKIECKQIFQDRNPKVISEVVWSIRFQLYTPEN